MKKWRSLFAVTAIAAMVFAMAACGDKETDVEPTSAPATEAPAEPTEAPAEPTEAPVVEPTEAPVVEPTEEPVVEPTEAPVVEPTEAPAEPTAAPTEAPVATPEPTATPAPTATPEPTATPVPTEAPAAASASYKAGDFWSWDAWGQGMPDTNPAKADGSVEWKLTKPYEQILFTFPAEDGIDLSDYSQAVITFSSDAAVNVKIFPDNPETATNGVDTWDCAIKIVNSNETVIVDLKTDYAAEYAGRTDYNAVKLGFEKPEGTDVATVTFYSITFQ